MVTPRTSGTPVLHPDYGGVSPPSSNTLCLPCSPMLSVRLSVTELAVYLFVYHALCVAPHTMPVYMGLDLT